MKKVYFRSALDRHWLSDGSKTGRNSGRKLFISCKTHKSDHIGVITLAIGSTDTFAVIQLILCCRYLMCGLQICLDLQANLYLSSEFRGF